MWVETFYFTIIIIIIIILLACGTLASVGGDIRAGAPAVYVHWRYTAPPAAATPTDMFMHTCRGMRTAKPETIFMLLGLQLCYSDYSWYHYYRNVIADRDGP